MNMLAFDLLGILRDLIPAAFVLLGLITFRLRGSALWDLWTRTGTTGGRVQYAIVMALAAILLTRDWRLVDLAFAVFLGCIPPWFADGLVPLSPRRFAANAARGLLWLAPAAAALWWHEYPGWVWLLAAGPFSAPLYWLAWHVPFPALHYRHATLGWAGQMRSSRRVRHWPRPCTAAGSDTGCTMR